MMATYVALILVTVYQLSRNILKNVTGFIIAVLSFVLIVFLDVSAIFAIILGGLIGFIEYKIRKGKK